jgi:hypothetical protein
MKKADVNVWQMTDVKSVELSEDVKKKELPQCYNC